jgi:ubiquinone/menaquinone biosynthesis C-methylase UbiE
MNIIEIRKHWFAYIFDEGNNQIDDVEFMLGIIGDKSENILEVCCGTGRILIPLVKAGHKVVGIDIDEYMLERISKKSKDLQNIKYYKADAITDDWGNNFDCVILAGNLFMNIITDGDYKEIQKLFIQKAGKALKKGGYIYLDFVTKMNEAWVIHSDGDTVIHEGYDDNNIYGKFIYCKNGSYDRITQMMYGKRRIEIVLPNGEIDKYEYLSNKKIPTVNEVKEWLNENNFKIEFIYGNYNKAPIDENTDKAIIYARKI